MMICNIVTSCHMTNEITGSIPKQTSNLLDFSVSECSVEVSSLHSFFASLKKLVVVVKREILSLHQTHVDWMQSLLETDIAAMMSEGKTIPNWYFHALLRNYIVVTWLRKQWTRVLLFRLHVSVMEEDVMGLWIATMMMFQVWRVTSYNRYFFILILLLPTHPPTTTTTVFTPRHLLLLFLPLPSAAALYNPNLNSKPSRHLFGAVVPTINKHR